MSQIDPSRITTSLKNSENVTFSEFLAYICVHHTTSTNKQTKCYSYISENKGITVLFYVHEKMACRKKGDKVSPNSNFMQCKIADFD